MKRLSRMEFGNLINASAKVGDEFDKDVELVKSPVVQRALKAQKEKDEQSIQDQILAVLDQARVVREAKVAKIRELRKAVNKQLSDLAKLDQAEKLGTDSGDFRILLSLLGQRVPDVKVESFDDFDGL